MLVFFFFQAEDGIRYLIVTGVQTCALPIFAVVFETIIALTLYFINVLLILSICSSGISGEI